MARERNRVTIANWILFGLNGTLCVAFLIFFSTRLLYARGWAIEYKDLIVILLTALTALLAALALFIGILAIFGYTTIRDSAMRRVEEMVAEAKPKLAREAEAAASIASGAPPSKADEDALTKELSSR